MCSLLQLAVLLIGDGLAPLVGALGAGHLDGEVGEPAVRGSTVPVLDLGGDVDAVAGVQFHGGLALLLVVAAAGHADEDLAAAGLCVMDVPVVAAARLKGHVVDAHLLGGDGGQITLADKILRIGHVGFADGEHHGRLVLCPGAAVLRLHGPDLLCHVEHGPALGPADVKRNVGDDGGDLLLGHAVVLGVLQVILQRGIGHAGRHQRNHGEDAAGLQVDGVIVPVLAKENVVVVVSKCRCECAQRIAASGLYDLFHKSCLL